MDVFARFSLADSCSDLDSHFFNLLHFILCILVLDTINNTCRLNLIFSHLSWETGMVWWHSSDYLSSVGKWKLRKRQLSFFRDVYRQNRMLLVLTQLTQPPWYLYAIAHACFYTSKRTQAQKLWQLIDYKWITVQLVFDNYKL